MIRFFTLIISLIHLCSCSTDPKRSKKLNSPITSLENVKIALARQDEIPVDSVHTVKLKAKNLYIIQGFGRVDNMIRLVKVSSTGFSVLDSILSFQQIAIYRQKKISYDLKNDWFTYSNISSGTGDLSKTITLVRIENNCFSELFTYTKNANLIDVEAEDKIRLPYSCVRIEALKMNKRQLVLKTEFEYGVENTSVPSEIRIIDTVTFEFSKTVNKFLLKSPIDPLLKKEFWMDKKGEYLFRI